jgi:hypothetical protein
MKLRNKKTGIMGSIEYDLRTIYPLTGEPLLTVRYKDTKGITCYIDYKTVAEFNDNWEDYKPAEPLIKDKKIRKAVRAWWESIPLEIADKQVLYKNNQDFAIGVYTIYCGAIYPEGTLKEGKTYTIDELCGEEGE